MKWLLIFIVVVLLGSCRGNPNDKFYIKQGHTYYMTNHYKIDGKGCIRFKINNDSIKLCGKYYIYLNSRSEDDSHMPMLIGYGIFL